MNDLDLLEGYIPSQKEAMPYEMKNRANVCKLIQEKVIPEIDKIKFPQYQTISLYSTDLFNVINVLKERGWNVNRHKSGDKYYLIIYAPGLLGKLQATLNMDLTSIVYLAGFLVVFVAAVICLFIWTWQTIIALGILGMIVVIFVAETC